jgi:hypothetical protein
MGYVLKKIDEKKSIIGSKTLVISLVFYLYMIPSTQGQTISKDKCIKEVVFTATLDSIPINSEFLPQYIDSLHCYPIRYSENTDKTEITKIGNRFKNFTIEELIDRKITSYIEVLSFDLTSDSAYLELYNRVENIYVISKFSIFDCQIIGGETDMFEL